MLDGAGRGCKLNFEGDVEEVGKGGNRGESDIFDESESDYVGIEVRIDDLLEGSKELLFTVCMRIQRALMTERRTWEMGGLSCVTGMGSGGPWEGTVVEEGGRMERERRDEGHLG